jgi:hypothetical protein
VTQVSNIRMANGELIPDDWFENDMGPNAELAKMEPDGFIDQLIEKIMDRSPQTTGPNPLT